MRAFSLAVFFLMAFVPSVAFGSDGHGGVWDPNPVLVVPFALLLLAIACFPLLPRTHHWWESNRSKAIVAGALSVPVLFATLYYQPAQLPHTGWEYFQFVALLGALYIVAGGIHIRGDLQAIPEVNAAFLLVGFLLASCIGTTGASMVLIFPLLRTNSQRRNVVATFLFFILMVSNSGGQLTPVGDPPLYLGFLRGVPFFWWSEKLWWVWVVTGVYLLSLYYVIDKIAYAREKRMDVGIDRGKVEPLSVMGKINIIFLAGIVASTIFLPAGYREIAYLAIAWMSFALSGSGSNAEARQRNKFGFGPIVEVLVLFAGIFITMVPALKLLELHGSELGVTRPWQYFLATGVFSSLLDNAPTYLIFSQLGMSTEGVTTLGEFAAQFPILHAAISVGAVFMGANTYVGNAPNFMVKATCESQGVKMPNFFSYAFYAILIMSPVYIFVALVLPYVR